MLKFFKWIATPMASLLWSHALALNLELTQGIVSAIPVAIYSFSQPQSVDADKTNISQVIANDLTMSGRFNVTPMAFDQNLNALSINQQNQWQRSSISDVLIGSIHKEIDGHFSVDAQWIDVATQALLWHHTYHVAANELRQTAHQISDQIFEKITNTPGVFTTKIAYIHVLGQAPGAKQYRLEVSDMDGFNPKILVVSSMPLMSPAWSPDGQQIAYVSFEHQKAHVYLQNISDGSRVQMSDEIGFNNAPAFSPDGKTLALVQTIDGYPHIVLMALNTGKITPLTFGYFEDTEPHFSPDGQSIIFTSTRDGGYQLYQMNLKSQIVNRITYQGSYNASGQFFPDSTTIALLHDDRGMLSIAKQNIHDSDALHLLDKNDSDASPSISPNGQMIVFSQDFQGQRILALVSQDGLAKSRLPALMGDVENPAWSPFLKDSLLNSAGE